MTQKDRELLLKDLCARLPYGINCEYQGKVHGIVGFNLGKVTIYEHFQSEPKFPFIEEVKLYLFTLSSMTDRQKIELTCIIDSDYAQIDWYNRNHLDYRGLIPKGLAIDATGLNIY